MFEFQFVIMITDYFDKPLIAILDMYHDDLSQLWRKAILNVGEAASAGSATETSFWAVDPEY